jgi:hypothetical protein
LRPRRAKERVRFLADFAVTAKEPQWQFVLKSTPNLVLAIALLDSIKHTTTAREETFEILVTEIPDRIFNLVCLSGRAQIIRNSFFWQDNAA